jgi:hypothetical protein
MANYLALYDNIGGILTIMDTLVGFANIFMLGFVVESTVEYFFKGLGEYKKYIAAGFGAAIALAFQVNMFLTVFGLGEGNVIAYWAGTVLTGLLIGRGANWLHDFHAQYVTREP